MKKTLQLGFALIIWYTSSAWCSMTSKEFLAHFGSPWWLSLFQLSNAMIFNSLALKIFKGSFHPEEISNEMHQREIYKITAAVVLGFLFFNVGYNSTHLFLMETLRSGEPLFVIVLSWFLFKEKSLVFLVPIVVGVVLTSFSNTYYIIGGVFFATLANVAFAFRSLTTQKLLSTLKFHNLDLFAHILRCGFAFQASMCAISGNLYSIDIVRLTQYQVYLIVTNGFTFFLYNQLSFFLLSTIHVVTHSVANSFRRVFTIVFAIVYFRLPMTLTGIVGILLATIGIIGYSSSSSTKTSKDHQIKSENNRVSFQS